MKRSLIASLLLNILLLVAVGFWHERTAKAGGGGEDKLTAVKNGDTNGDGNLDLSDAVYLLNFLFTGGPDLATIECPSTTPGSCLVATGQTTCWGTEGPIDCSVPKARGQDAFYGLGCPLEGRFTDNGDGTISDQCTGLMWTKTSVDVDGDGEITHATDTLQWLDACQFAEDMTYLGHSDWRVPNLNEMLSIMDWGDAGNRRPYSSVFGFIWSWTSTRYFAAGDLSVSPAGCVCPVCSLGGDSKSLFAAVRGP